MTPPRVRSSGARGAVSYVFRPVQVELGRGRGRLGGAGGAPV